MDKFSLNIKPENKDTFSELRYEKNINILRREIHDFIIEGKEDDFFDFVIFRFSNLSVFCFFEFSFNRNFRKF